MQDSHNAGLFEGTDRLHYDIFICNTGNNKEVKAHACIGDNASNQGMTRPCTDENASKEAGTEIGPPL
jgi:hypothetical protein